MSDFRVLIDPMKVPSSYSDKSPHEICYLVCCRVWPTAFDAHMKAGRCGLCGLRPQLLLTDGNQVKLAQGIIRD